MNSLLRISKNILTISIPTGVPSEARKNISMFPKLCLKEIKEVQKDKELIIYGENIKSEREPYLIKTPHSNACPLCATGVEVKHTDVLILSQFVRSDGCMLPRRVTGLCKTQQKRMSSLVTMAHKSGLMPNLKPANSKKDPTKRQDWKKLNKYFDESTIQWKL